MRKRVDKLAVRSIPELDELAGRSEDFSIRTESDVAKIDWLNLESGNFLAGGNVPQTRGAVFNRGVFNPGNPDSKELAIWTVDERALVQPSHIKGRLFLFR